MWLTLTRSDAVWLRVGILGILVVYPLQLLHARDTGPDVHAFEEGLGRKLQTYLWLYLHMPLTMALSTTAPMFSLPLLSSFGVSLASDDNTLLMMLCSSP